MICMLHLLELMRWIAVIVALMEYADVACLHAAFTGTAALDRCDRRVDEMCRCCMFFAGCGIGVYCGLR
uniref:Putative secreted protein n=1 Tax=Anopheles darlingi TaxID=43151 RepID=A0A2M4DGP1_ANODA